MMEYSVARGRVIEVWSEQNTHFIELVIYDERLIFKSQKKDGVTPAFRGDIVEITFEKPNLIIQLSRLNSAQSNWDLSGDSLRWRKLNAPSRMNFLRLRQEILLAIRLDLYDHGFLEVETPLLVKGTCPDFQIQPAIAQEGYLVSSTEYQIKRLIVGGFERLCTLTKNFRANERSSTHSSEFTMLEWARTFESLDVIEEDAVRFIQAAFSRIHPDKTSIEVKGCTIQIKGTPWERLTVREAFTRYLGFAHLLDFSLKSLLLECDQAKIELPDHFRADQHLVLSFLLDRVQTHLGNNTPTFLREWPAFMTSSAKINSSDPETAERSELYIGGIEISDGFPFLRDSEKQILFFERENDLRKKGDQPVVALDYRYIEAMREGLPPGAGMALGIDRLVMVLTGAEDISQVQTFSWDEI